MENEFLKEIEPYIINQEIIDKYTKLFNKYEAPDTFNNIIEATEDEVKILNIANNNLSKRLEENKQLLKLYKEWIFNDNITSEFNFYIDDFIKILDITLPVEIEKLFNYKLKKYYYANRFSSLMEYFIFNDIDPNEVLSSINQEQTTEQTTENIKRQAYKLNFYNDIIDVRLLFFICASYALLDTFMDETVLNTFSGLNSNEAEQSKLTLIKEIDFIFDNKFKSLLSHERYQKELNKEKLNPLITLLDTLLRYINLSNSNLYNRKIILIIYYCFKLQIECAITQKTETTNQELIKMMIKKGMSSLLLSFCIKDDYLEEFIEYCNIKNENTDIVFMMNTEYSLLLMFFSLMSQCTSDVFLMVLQSTSHLM